MDELPTLIELVADTLVCAGCGRRWHAQRDGRLNAPNRQYLTEHVIGHLRRQRAHRPQQWPPGLNRETPNELGAP